MNQASSESQHQVLHTEDPHEAEAATAGPYLPNHLYPLESGDLDVHLDMLHLGSVTVGRLSYGVDAGLRTDEAGQYLLSVPLRGQAVSRATNNEPEPMGSGQAAVFMPDLPADALWMHDSTQLFVLVPKAMLESEVEQLLGASLGGPIRFERRMDLTAPAAQGLRETLAALVSELDGGTEAAGQGNLPQQLVRTLVDGIIAQAIGRWGNWFNQELYGRPTTLPWGLEIDPEHREEGYEQFSTFHPTYLYEFFWNLGVAGLLVWADRRFRLGYGRVFALYVMGYTSGRAWIEYLRIDKVQEDDVFGLRLNVWTSIVLFLAALGYFLWSQYKHPGREEQVLRDGYDEDDSDAVAPEQGDAER